VVNAVVDIARLDAGKVEVELGPVYVAAIIGEVRDLLRVSAADRGLRLEVPGPIESLPLAWADSDKVRQILLNLVGNAIKFTERGDVVIGVEPDLAREQLHIAVRDTGIGIAAEKQGRLFQPFVQADREVARRFGGTGLGLSISRRLAERMGGSVTLFSAGEGQGSTFTLTLPLAPAA
jgi:signal transduction histidine kinase